MPDQVETPEPIRPRLVVEFLGPHSDQCRVTSTGLSVGQRLIAARLVDQWDRDTHQAELAQTLQLQEAIHTLPRKERMP